MQAVVLRRQPIAFSHVMLDPAAVTVAPSRSGALLNARQQHASSCNAQAADRIITRHTWPCRCDCRSVSLWRSAHGSSVACRQQIARARVMPRFAAVASLAGALVSCSTRHACSAACRLQIASTCVTLGPATAAVAQSRSGAVLITCQQLAGSCNAQAADRILTCDAWPCRYDGRSVSLVHC